MSAGTSRKVRQHRKRMARLFANQGGRCKWCAQPMLLIHRRWEGRQPPKNLATLEHIISRVDPRYGKVPHEYAVACLECNQARGTIHNYLATKLSAAPQLARQPEFFEATIRRFTQFEQGVA